MLLCHEQATICPRLTMCPLIVNVSNVTAADAHWDQQVETPPRSAAITTRPPSTFDGCCMVLLVPSLRFDQVG